MASRADLEGLSEGQVLDSVDLTLAEASGLNTTGLVSLQPSVSGWRVTAAHAVGAVRCGNLRVRVHPKVGTVQVLRLLARAHGVRGIKINESLIGVESNPDLTAVLAILFAEEAATALATGPLRGYRTEDQSGNVLRGQLRMRDQELRRFGLPLPLEVTVDEWTTDTIENRRLRAANQRLLSLTDLPSATRRRLIRLDRVLADVWSPPRGAVLQSWVPTRLNLRLHRLLHLADLVLDQTTVEHRVGDVEVHGFVLSMSWLFERLVAELMSEIRGKISVRTQPSYPLDRAGHLTIKPDLVFMDGLRVMAVADTKYKLLADNGSFPNADAYQLVAYCARLGLGVGHLIYSAGESCPASFEIAGTDVRLFIHAIDLTQPLDELLLQIRSLAEVILPSNNSLDEAGKDKNS